MTGIEFKKLGNDAFVSKDYLKAIENYKKAIEKDPANPIFYGNLSAALHRQGEYQNALIQAKKAIQLDPTFVKGFVRKAMALISLNHLKLALDTYNEAIKIDSKNSYIIKQIKILQNSIQEGALKTKVTESTELVNCLGSLYDMHLRLGTMATLWNVSSQADRLSIFQKFLCVINGGGTKADFFDETKMIELPMNNYSDIEVSAQWEGYYRGLPSVEKTIVFGQCWEICTDTEKELIINDFRFFFMREPSSATTNDEGEDATDNAGDVIAEE